MDVVYATRNLARYNAALRVAHWETDKHVHWIFQKESYARDQLTLIFIRKHFVRLPGALKWELGNTPSIFGGTV